MKMNTLGITTGLDLRAQSLEFLNANFRKAGEYYYWIARGVDDRQIRVDRTRKSLGVENIADDIFDFEAACIALAPNHK